MTSTAFYFYYMLSDSLIMTHFFTFCSKHCFILLRMCVNCIDIILHTWAKPPIIILSSQS